MSHCRMPPPNFNSRCLCHWSQSPGVPPPKEWRRRRVLLCGAYWCNIMLVFWLIHWLSVKQHVDCKVALLVCIPLNEISSAVLDQCVLACIHSWTPSAKSVNHLHLPSSKNPVTTCRQKLSNSRSTIVEQSSDLTPGQLRNGLKTCLFAESMTPL